MKQSFLGYIWEFISYGQGSFVEKQALAMNILADELAKKYGYQNTRTWSDVFDGQVGRYEKSK